MSADVLAPTVYPKKYAHGFVVLYFVVVMQSFITNSHEVFIHIHKGCFAGTGAIVRLPQCQWSKPDGYEKISQCITTTKHSKAKTVCIFLGIYCSFARLLQTKCWLQKLRMCSTNIFGYRWYHSKWPANLQKSCCTLRVNSSYPDGICIWYPDSVTPVPAGVTFTPIKAWIWNCIYAK